MINKAAVNSFDKIPLFSSGQKALGKNQRGAALIVSLMILIIISALGISAMKTSMFQSKIATSAQTSAMSFQAAESAIAAVYREAIEGEATDPSNVLGSAMAALGSGIVEIQHRCVEKNNIDKQAECTSADFLDSRGIVQAGSRTIVTGQPRPVGGGAITTSGSADVQFVYYTFLTVGEGKVPAFNISHYNVQEFTKIGLYQGGSF